MPVVSITRVRLRSMWFVPLFLMQAQRIISQIRRADGHLGGAVRRDGDLVYWTMSVWRDDAALVAFFTSGAHGKAMPRVAGWCNEAAVARWGQDESTLPSWSEAAHRLRIEGRPTPLQQASAEHASLNFAPPSDGQDLRF